MSKALVVSVGGTIQPIIKSICEHKPEFVSFFSSQDSADMVAQIKAEVANNGLRIKSEITVTDDVNDLLHCYTKAEETVGRVISKGYLKEDVIVDYTGGTKNMSVALALAAITHGFSFSYVGGKERTKEGIGIVVNGKEVIYQSINPWDFLAVEEKKKIALLFNQFQFKAAKEMTDKLQEKSTIYKSVFKKLGFLIEGYHKWDWFRYSEALESFKRARLEELLETDDKSVVSFARESSKIRNFLEMLARNPQKPSLTLILDMFSNAERRFKEGKIDDAVLRLYRLVELIAQEKLLTNHGIDASDVKKEQIPDKLQTDFMNSYKSPRDGKIKIPQTAAFSLLYALGDELGKSFETNKSRFLDIQSSRNYSYLAHGFEYSNEKTFLILKEFILGLGMFKAEDVPIFPKIEI